LGLKSRPGSSPGPGIEESKNQGVAQGLVTVFRDEVGSASAGQQVARERGQRTEQKYDDRDPPKQAQRVVGGGDAEGPSDPAGQVVAIVAPIAAITRRSATWRST